MKRILFLLIIGMATGLMADIKVSDFINHKQCDKVYSTSIYDSCYDYNHKGTTAVSYTIKFKDVYRKNIRKRPRWVSPSGIDAEYIPTNSDYYKNKKKYNKGHLANDASFDYDARVLKQTYILGVNAVPQDRKVNKYNWAKAEIFTRDLTKIYKTIHILDIVHYGKKTIGKHRIGVPDYFYKVVIIPKRGTMCFKYSNNPLTYKRSDTLFEHLVPCSTIRPAHKEKVVRAAKKKYKSEHKTHTYTKNNDVSSSKGTYSIKDLQDHFNNR